MAKIALLIGVSEYAPGLNPLPAAVKDVEAMRRVLVNPERGGFAETDVTVLKNPQRQEMEEAIYRLFANRQKEDLLLFYFSGHGVKDESGRLYFSTVATCKENGRLVKPSALAASVLHEYMNESKSQREVIVLDCCFSGAIAQGLTVKDDGSVNLQEELGGKGRAILTSSSSTQYSFEQEGSELSIYTRYLVEGIENGAADKDGDGKISADELHEYASDKVTEAAPAMTPKFYPVEEGYKIFLAKSPKDDPKVKYRREVESRAKQNQGKFSVFARGLLDGKRVEWGLSETDAKLIKDEVLQPFREYERKLQEYEQCLMQAIEAEYPFSKSTEADLKDYQKYLGLRDEDIAAIDARVIAPKEAEYVLSLHQLQPQQTSPPTPFLAGEGSNNTPPPFPAREGGSGGLGLSESNSIESDLSSQPAKSQPKIQTQPFEFETATLSVTKSGGLFGIGEKVIYNIQRSRKRGEFLAENLGNGVTLEMVAIPGGTFLMGSPTDEPERKDSESPQHSVSIKPFFMGKFPITQAQWQAVAGFPKVKIDLNPEPSYFKGANRPVETIFWYRAEEFCARLSQKTGRTYRLPSEAEWEYACRAGTTTPFHFGETITTDLANYNGNNTYGSGAKGIYRKQTSDVGTFPANAFGLYDMHGNVWEWCADHWHENYINAPNDKTIWLSSNEASKRVLRGGSCDGNPRLCRSASRNNNDAGFSSHSGIGFRVVCAAAWT